MATILVVEDRLVDRKLLSTVLRLHGHDIVEAADGEAALTALTTTRPDLIISDILMPTMDGYEFVRRLRTMSALAKTPVIFYTATYHEREARTLAHRCGVFHILTKPSPAGVILEMVAKALALTTAPVALPDIDRDEFQRDHLDLVNSTLASRVARFDADKERLTAITELMRQLAAEHGSRALLEGLCRDARHVTLAQTAVVGLAGPKGAIGGRVYTSGVSDVNAPGQRETSETSGAIATVFAEGRPVRIRHAKPDKAAARSTRMAKLVSWLGVPIATSRRVYGWISLANKLGADEFTEDDEAAALSLAAHAAVLYENARQLESVRRRVRTAERARLARTIHDEFAQALVAVKFDLSALDRKVAATSPVAKRPDLTRAIGTMAGRVDELIHSVHDIARTLRPAAPDAGNLTSGVKAQAKMFERRSSIACPVDAPSGRLTLDRDRSALAIRVVQEALSNVAKHARAKRVAVSIRQSDSGVVITVTDDGVGIPTAKIWRASSLGLIGMRERAALAGGRFDVRRGPHGGTVVRLHVPRVTTREKERLSS